MTVWLTWDDSFGAAGSDYDMYATDNTDALVAFSNTDNVATTDPVEVVAFTNSAGESHLYHILSRTSRTPLLRRLSTCSSWVAGFPVLTPNPPKEGVGLAS